MTRRRWWLGVAALVVAVLLHAAVPRYSWLPVAGEPGGLVRIDRWTGRAEWGRLDPATGAWRLFVDPTAKAIADIDRALASQGK